MDIEGAEDKVFRGMKRHLEDAPWVVFEYTKVEGDALLSELRQSGNVFSITQAGDLQEVGKAEYYPVGRGGNPYANFVYRRGVKSELA